MNCFLVTIGFLLRGGDCSYNENDTISDIQQQDESVSLLTLVRNVFKNLNSNNQSSFASVETYTKARDNFLLIIIPVLVVILLVACICMICCYCGRLERISKWRQRYFRFI